MSRLTDPSASASIAHELTASPLGDARIIKRCSSTLEKMSWIPQHSTNSAFNSGAETFAAYRCLNNPKVTAPKLLQRHRQRALPIEEKSSFRWPEGDRLACDLQAQVPDKKVISISDREGDIFEIYA